MAPSLPPLKESQVRSLATEKSFERGQRYYRNGTISNPTLQGNRLWANCEGSMTYYPSATLGPQGVEASDCTCPYDWGGLCKHQVALLLTYIHDHQSFHRVPPMSDLLAQRSREELVDLIDRMVQRHPDLLDWVDRPTAAAGETPNLDHYRRAVERVFHNHQDMYAMAEALGALVDQADALTQLGDWANAGDIYQLLLEAANEEYDDSVLEIDYDGKVGSVIQAIAEGLGDSLREVQGDMSRRRLWIETCLDAVFKDLELGGIDYAYPAQEALLEHGTDEDWAWVEGQIRQAIQGGGRRRYSPWSQEHLVKLLTQRAKQRGTTDVGSLVLDLGTPRQQASYYLQRGQFDEALTLARQHLLTMPGGVIALADDLLEADQPELALALVQESQQQQDNYHYGDWLLTFWKRHGTPDQVVEAQYDRLKQRFTLADYQELQTLAVSLGQWDVLRQQIVAQLQQSQRINALMEIALLEQDWQAAVGYLTQGNLLHKKTYSLRVAQAIEAHEPEAAITLYQEAAERAISNRGRENYQRAADYLTRMKRLSEGVGQTQRFSQYLQTLRDQHKGLRALRDELNRVGL